VDGETLKVNGVEVNGSTFRQTTNPQIGYLELLGSDLPEGAVAYWAFDEGSGTIATDSIFEANNGTIINGATWVSPGVSGNALSFDGINDYISVPHSSLVEPTNLTIEAWINIPVIPGGTDPRRWIVNKNTHESTQGHYALMINGSRVGAYLNIGGGSGNVFSAWSDTGAITANTWYHLAMTYDSSILKVYLNGALIAQTIINRTRVSGTTSLDIGRRQDGFNYTNAFIDEIVIYNRALTAEEIAAQYSFYTPP
jgi:hypothetical protein